MDPTQYQIPPWLFAQGAAYSPQMLGASGITGGVPGMYGQPSGPAMLNSTQFPTNMQTTGGGMDSQKMAAILGALAPLASRGQEGNGGGYMRMPEAQRMPADPNYRPQWQLQFTPGQGLQMLSPMMRRR